MKVKKQLEVNCWNCCWFEPDKDKENIGECTRKIAEETKKCLQMNFDKWCYYFKGFD